MASHFSDIGFVVASTDDLLALARAVPSDTPAQQIEAGTYLRWSPGSGAELWFQRSDEGMLVGVNPHFDATTPTRVRLTSRVPDEGHPLDGAFHAWLDPAPIDPADPDPEAGAVPVLIDVPDYRLHDGVQLPIELDMAIAGFAQSIAVYADEAAFQVRWPRFAAESLIPSGLFLPGGDARVPPRAEAMVNGRVEAGEVRTNPSSGRAFLWCRVRTYGARLEIVADRALVPEPPSVGAIVSGTFWLSGRILRP